MPQEHAFRRVLGSIDPSRSMCPASEWCNAPAGRTNNPRFGPGNSRYGDERPREGAFHIVPSRGEEWFRRLDERAPELRPRRRGWKAAAGFSSCGGRRRRSRVRGRSARAALGLWPRAVPANRGRVVEDAAGHGRLAMKAMSFSRAPQWGQARTSTAKTFFRRSAQGTRRDSELARSRGRGCRSRGRRAARARRTSAAPGRALRSRAAARNGSSRSRTTWCRSVCSGSRRRYPPSGEEAAPE